MSGDTRTMRAYIDQRTRECPAYLVLTDALLGLHPLVVGECECIVAEILGVTEGDVCVGYDEAKKAVDDLTLANGTAVESQLELLALMPPRIAGPLRSLLRQEEGDSEIYPVAQLLVARLIRLQLQEVSQIAQAQCV